MKIILNQINNVKNSLSVFAPGKQLNQDQYTLINDKVNPGSYHVYSTDENGIKGWYDFPVDLFPGTIWLHGSINPTSNQGKDRDFYLNTTDNNIFNKDAIENHLINLSTSSISVSSFLDNDAVTYDPDFMIDGDDQTNWSSGIENTQTVTFDLGEENEELIHSINLSWFISEVLTNYEIDILGSNDGVNFAHIHEVYNGNSAAANTTLVLPSDDFMKYRFIQIKFEHPDEITTNSFSISEIILNGRSFDWQQIGTLGGGTGGTIEENWQVIDTDQTAVNNEKYAANTSSGILTLIVPNNPSVNDRFFFNDALKTFDTNSLFINQSASGEFIQGLDENLEIDVKGVTGEIVYVGGDIGWMIVN